MAITSILHQSADLTTTGLLLCSDYTQGEALTPPDVNVDLEVMIWRCPHQETMFVQFIVISQRTRQSTAALFLDDRITQFSRGLGSNPVPVIPHTGRCTCLISCLYDDFLFYSSIQTRYVKERATAKIKPGGSQRTVSSRGILFHLVLCSSKQNLKCFINRGFTTQEGCVSLHM